MASPAVPRPKLTGSSLIQVIGQKLAPFAISVRSQAEADLDALCDLYVRSRWHERAASVAPVDDTAWKALLTWQFELQHRHYTSCYPGGLFFVLSENNRILGRLSLHQRSGELHLVDILLAPEVRNRGIGRCVLEALQEGSRHAQGAISLEVDVQNPARRLYHRLGFLPTATSGPCLRLVWTPQKVASIP